MLVCRGHVVTYLLLMFAAVMTQVVGTSAGSRVLVNDDNWHTIFLRRQADTFQLTVDDRDTAPVTGQLSTIRHHYIKPNTHRRRDATVDRVESRRRCVRNSQLVGDSFDESEQKFANRESSCVVTAV